MDDKQVTMRFGDFCVHPQIPLPDEHTSTSFFIFKHPHIRIADVQNREYFNNALARVDTPLVFAPTLTNNDEETLYRSAIACQPISPFTIPKRSVSVSCTSACIIVKFLMCSGQTIVHNLDVVVRGVFVGASMRVFSAFDAVHPLQSKLAAFQFDIGNGRVVAIMVCGCIRETALRDHGEWMINHIRTQFYGNGVVFQSAAVFENPLGSQQCVEMAITQHLFIPQTINSHQYMVMLQTANDIIRQNMCIVHGISLDDETLLVSDIVKKLVVATGIREATPRIISCVRQILGLEMVRTCTRGCVSISPYHAVATNGLLLEIRAQIDRIVVFSLHNFIHATLNEVAHEHQHKIHHGFTRNTQATDARGFCRVARELRDVFVKQLSVVDLLRLRLVNREMRNDIFTLDEIMYKSQVAFLSSLPSSPETPFLTDLLTSGVLCLSLFAPRLKHSPKDLLYASRLTTYSLYDFSANVHMFQMLRVLSICDNLRPGKRNRRDCRCDEEDGSFCDSCQRSKGIADSLGVSVVQCQDAIQSLSYYATPLTPFVQPRALNLADNCPLLARANLQLPFYYFKEISFPASILDINVDCQGCSGIYIPLQANPRDLIVSMRSPHPNHIVSMTTTLETMGALWKLDTLSLSNGIFPSSKVRARSLSLEAPPQVYSNECMFQDVEFLTLHINCWAEVPLFLSLVDMGSVRCLRLYSHLAWDVDIPDSLRRMLRDISGISLRLPVDGYQMGDRFVKDVLLPRTRNGVVYDTNDFRVLFVVGDETVCREEYEFLTWKKIN